MENIASIDISAYIDQALALEKLELAKVALLATNVKCNGGMSKVRKGLVINRELGTDILASSNEGAMPYSMVLKRYYELMQAIEGKEYTCSSKLDRIDTATKILGLEFVALSI